MIASSWDIRHVELSGERPEVAANPRPLFVVFWWRALPLGIRTYLPEQLPLDSGELAALTAELAATQLAARAPQFGGPARATIDGRPLIAVPLGAIAEDRGLLNQLDRLADDSAISVTELSVIVCTRDRPDALERCLASLVAQENPPGQIIVVDNSKGRTAEAVTAQVAGVEYVHEPRPGLSVARNAGIRASRGALIAFTDDDVEVASSWTAEIARALSSAGVEAVTGLVLPARLATPAQCFFQFRMGGLGSECVPIIFDGRFFAETCPMGAQVWRIGAGANMAFRRSLFDRIGLFDERLGAGASGCSEDSELWYRLLAGGGACLYEPRACVTHHHREEWDALRRQVRAYMKGHVSALFVQAARFRHYGNIRRAFRQLPGYFVRTAFRAVRDGGGIPRLQILWDEFVGWLCGLHYAIRPRWHDRSGSPSRIGPVGASTSESRP
ncbi:glycosyltransferase family 2 protein [Dongia deserti]|uniref:glycosyltransferase family 2 protein n=1 Tax=Dongia deserti TaxID=2268030 RepID=UPI002548714B|nr:glycosyltransferase [Dongia deserti]